MGANSGPCFKFRFRKRSAKKQARWPKVQLYSTTKETIGYTFVYDKVLPLQLCTTPSC